MRLDFPMPHSPEMPTVIGDSTNLSQAAQKHEVSISNISQAAQKHEVSISNEMSLHKLEAGKGLFKKGLYRIVLGYLAYPSFKLPVNKRHQIVGTLWRSAAYETSEPLTVSYTLDNIVAIAGSVC
ncbi:hypothetical protein KI387_043432, partial [Taxus chinensis]